MMQMNAKGIQIRDVQVLDLQPDARRMMVGIKMDLETNSDLNLPSAKVQASEKLQAALRYLYHEGFVNAPIEMARWNIQVFAGLKQ
jgi:hypothetical protein